MDTAGSILLQQAIKLDPDFSEWRDNPRPGDEDFGPAPEIAGQYLAKKKELIQKKKTNEIPRERIQQSLVEMTALVLHAELEFLNHIRGLGNERRLRMRSNGRIVLVKNENDK